MSVDTVQAPLAIDVSGLRIRLAALIRAFGLMFSAVAFGTVQFFSHSMPSPHIVYVPTEVIFYAFGIGMVLPALVLLVIDRAIVANDASGVWVRRYRAGVFAVATVLVLRQLQLYFGPVESAFAAAGMAAGMLFVALTAGIVAAVARWYEFVRNFYATAAPAIVIFVLFTMMQMTQRYELPAAYATETPDGHGDNPPVFIIVADELSYQVLTQGDDDEIDRDRFPNLAALADDSAWVTDASTNYVHTTFILPALMESTTSVSDEYQLRMYSQYALVESLAWDECGTAFTCRGAAYLSKSHDPELAGTILRRALFQAAPSLLSDALTPATSWLDGSLHTPGPDDDPHGMHTFTTEGFESFLADVNPETVGGSLYFYHVLLPHTPMVFHADGSIRSGGDDEDGWELYGEQTTYFDSLIGRLVTRLKAVGVYDDAVIMLTGDHGHRPYSIDNGDFSQTPPEVPDMMAHVPLLVHSPAVDSGVYHVDYQHKDFEATLLDALGRDPSQGDGVSAFAAERPDRDKKFYLDQLNERYWTYAFNEESGLWDLVDFVDGPLAIEGLDE